MPVDSSIQAVLQEHTLVTVARWDHAAIHEVKLNKLSICQVQIHGDQLTAAALHARTQKSQSIVTSFTLK